VGGRSRKKEPDRQFQAVPIDIIPVEAGQRPVGARGSLLRTGDTLPKVKFYATLRKAAGSHEIEHEAGSVQEMLERLSTDFDGRLERYLKSCTVLVNGKNITLLQGTGTALEPGDTVSIYPRLAGG
jgi:molybdopterin converting factor small subunit